MQTIGHRYHGPLYNYTDLCDHCGTPWHRTDLVLDADGLLRCPQCISGKSLREIADEVAAETGYIQPVLGKTREGP